MKYILMLLLLIGCNEIERIDIKEVGLEDNSPTEATPIPTVEPSNPVVSEKQIFGQNNNLWKPVSDTTGNVVVLFNKKFVKLFSKGCYATLNNGNKDYLFCNPPSQACFSNGDRMTLRGNYKCKEYKNTKVICEEDKQLVTFTANSKKTCNRF